MRFSIIIPAYNVESLIEDCLQSLVWQDYPKEDYEVLIIEDCSTDSTYAKILSLIERYQKDPLIADLNITVIKHEQNKRQGGGRNTGLRAAKGDYVLFVDSDDYYLGNNVLKDLSSIIEKRDVSMIVSVSIRSVAYKSKPESKITLINSGVRYYSNEEYLLSDFYSIEVVKACYNRSVIMNNNLFFRENVAFEDTDWSFMMCLKATSVALIDFPFYGYRNNPNSTTNALSVSTRIHNVKALVALYDFIKRNDIFITDPVKRKFFRRIGSSVKGCMMKSYIYNIYETITVVDSIPMKLYNKEIKQEFPLHDRLLLTIERYLPIFVILILRMLYLIKSLFRIRTI